MKQSRECFPLQYEGCHRIIECLGLEGTFKGHLAQPLTLFQRKMADSQFKKWMHAFRYFPQILLCWHLPDYPK